MYRILLLYTGLVDQQIYNNSTVNDLALLKRNGFDR